MIKSAVLNIAVSVRDNINFLVPMVELFLKITDVKAHRTT
jgi:hypothetical protein